MSFPVAEIENKIGYRFKNQALLRLAFTHSSYVNGTHEESNERLEFLGDAVLELVVSEALYADPKKPSEGEMTALRQKLVSKSALLRAAEKLGLLQYLLLSGGKDNVGDKTVSSLVETVIAAIYLDGGYAPAKKFVLSVVEFSGEVNHIGALQEFLQKRREKPPVYEEIERTGADNAPTFRYRVTAAGKSADGVGGKISEAKQNAAKAVLQILKKGKTRKE